MHFPKQNKLYIPSPPFSKDIILDPNNQLSDVWKTSFKELHIKFDSVFEPIIGKYNDFSGKVRARINIGQSSPPTRKLHVPNSGKSDYAREEAKCVFL